VISVVADHGKLRQTTTTVLVAATQFPQLHTSKISAPRNQHLLNVATQKFAKMVLDEHTVVCRVGGPVALTSPLSTGPAAVGPGLAMRRLKMKMKRNLS
jgi:hypothetical protein